MEQFTDQVLVEEILAGSRVAFDGLMKRYERWVYRISFSYTRDPEDAMDVTQDVFLKVYSKLDTYRGSGAFRTWLLSIAHRENINWLRRHRKYRDHVGLTGETAPPRPATQESDVLKRERRTQLLGAMRELNPKQRLAITLRYYEQAQIREIATVLKCSEGTVKSILFRSLQKLRQQAAFRLGEDST
jgi:RNA polymerase sigma-70 factor (ECF subfamily)